MNSYFLLINMGSILGILIFFNLCKRESKSWKKALALLFISILVIETGSFAGKFVRFLSYGEGIDIRKIFIENHGTHFIGRVIFTVIVFPWFYRLVYRSTKQEWEKYLDLLCIFMAFQHIFNRAACLSNGCCMGKFYNGPFAFQYSSGTETGPGYSYPVYPTQLFEMICMILLLALLFVLYRMKKRLLVVFCSGFSVTIFLSEFMMDKQGTILVFGFSVIQFAALLLVGIAFLYVIVRKRIDCSCLFD